MERLALCHVGPKRIELRRKEVGVPGEGQVQVRAIASAISAGTELLVYRDQVGRGLKLDENLPESLLATLKGLGHDVGNVRVEGLRGRTDAEVWQPA